MDQTRLEPFWPACLAIRKNLLPSSIPHIPILIEDILQYMSLSDYDDNCVKNIQTIGEILPGAIRITQLQSISSDCGAKITLSLEELSIDAVYFKDGKGRYLPIWVFGTLQRRKNKVVLVAHKLLKIQDIYGSLNVLSLLSTAVCPMYYQYKELK